MPEQYTSLAKSSLSAGINDSTTSLTLDDASGFPATGNFSIRIDDEVMRCTARSGNVLTVARGQEGTSNVSHSAAALCICLATALSLDGVRFDVHRGGTLAALPATSEVREGDLYWPTDAFYVYRFNGSAWEAWGPLWDFVPPVTADFAWINQSVANLDTSKGGERVHWKNQSPAGNGWACRVKTLPGTPYSIEMCLLGSLPLHNGAIGSVILDNSAAPKTAIVHWTAPGLGLNLRKYADVTSLSSTTYTDDADGDHASRYFHWFRIDDNGTNLTWFYSVDGYTWIQFDQRGRTDFLVAPDRIGFAQAVNVEDSELVLVHWKES